MWGWVVEGGRVLPIVELFGLDGYKGGGLTSRWNERRVAFSMEDFGVKVAVWLRDLT